jgi:hypothetical protein
MVLGAVDVLASDHRAAVLGLPRIKNKKEGNGSLVTT